MARQPAATAAPAAWSDYFPSIPYARGDHRAELAAELADYLSSDGGSSFVSAMRPCGDGSYSLTVDYVALASQSGIGALPEALEFAPSEALACMAVAAHEVRTPPAH